MKKIFKRIPSRITWLFIRMLVFSFKTNFNLTGYSYDFEYEVQPRTDRKDIYVCK